MKKRQNNPDREERIHDEIIMDAYVPEEQAMGWYYYLENDPMRLREYFSGP